MTKTITWMGNDHTNSSDRGGMIPFVIVNHISAGTMSSMDNWFRSAGNEVSSAHFGVAKDGRIHQYVKIERMAWHAGLRHDAIPHATAEVVKKNPINPNLYSVGIEHEGTDGNLTEAQFESSVWLHKFIQSEVRRIYNRELLLNDHYVIGHFQVDPRRKPFCPGPKFPWARLYEALKEEPTMTKDDADKLIKICQAEWAKAKTADEKREWNRLANELRKVSGQQVK